MSETGKWFNYLAEINRILNRDLDASDMLDEIEFVIAEALHPPPPTPPQTDPLGEK